MQDQCCFGLRALLAVALLATTPSCSLIFVKSVPPSEGRLLPRAGQCTSSKVLPVLDTVITGLQGVRTVYAATAPDSVYENPNVPLSREADVGIGLGLMALFAGSAVYGFVNTSHCAKLKSRSDDDEALLESSEDAPIVSLVPSTARAN
jgi:hypothetical protein